MYCRELVDCSFCNWYPNFKNVSFRSIGIKLPEDFVSFLVQDGLQVADGNQALPVRGDIDQYADEDDYREWSSEDDDEAGAGEDAVAQVPSYHHVRTLVEEAIGKLGGKVVPKLNWSCPKDAIWINPRMSLACSNADEVFLMLKSSDRAAHDICHAFESCVDGPPLDPPGCTLVLKKWYDLHPEREFRCFVKDHQLIGVSQRDLTQYYPSLLSDNTSVLRLIFNFHTQHVRGVFPQAHYTYDVYVATKGVVRLMDFNPVGGTTAPLLFTWEELEYSPATPAEPTAPGGNTGGHSGPTGDADGSRDTEAIGCPDDKDGTPETVSGHHGTAQDARRVQDGGMQILGNGSERACEGWREASPPSVLPDVSTGAHLRRADGDQASERDDRISSSQITSPASHDTDPSSCTDACYPARVYGRGSAYGGESISGGAGCTRDSTGGLDGEQLMQDVEFRMLTDRQGIRPAAAAYGMPFDFVDTGPGGAADDLVRKLQEAQEAMQRLQPEG